MNYAYMIFTWLYKKNDKNLGTPKVISRNTNKEITYWTEIKLTEITYWTLNPVTKFQEELGTHREHRLTDFLCHHLIYISEYNHITSTYVK